jgi:hypothetical protein
MKAKLALLYILTLLFTSLSSDLAIAQTTDPLPSWNDGRARQSILAFVEKVTTEGAPDFVPPAERIATFDNDGTLWPSHPMYTQLAFALDRIKALAPQHPEWKNKQLFKGVLDNDLEALAAAGEKGMVELVMASHAGMSTAEFEAVVTDWLDKARHPRFKRRYTELAYQPMLVMEEAKKKGWVVISMKDDWKRIFGFEP